MEITISSKTGTLPPTRPVFPLWGHTANRLSLQNFNMADTSSVVFGFNTSVLFPVSNSFQRQAIYYLSALTLFFFCSIHYTRQFANKTLQNLFATMHGTSLQHRDTLLLRTKTQIRFKIRKNVYSTVRMIDEERCFLLPLTIFE